MRRTKVRILSLIASVVVGFGIGAFAVTAPASAGTCGTPYCGGVVKVASTSYIGVYVANNWCWGYPWTYDGHPLPCASGYSCHVFPAYCWINPGETTASKPAYYDVDAIMMRAGCKYYMYNETYGTYDIWDQRGVSYHTWKKVYDGDILNVYKVEC